MRLISKLAMLLLLFCGGACSISATSTSENVQSLSAFNTKADTVIKDQSILKNRYFIKKGSHLDVCRNFLDFSNSEYYDRFVDRDFFVLDEWPTFSTPKWRQLEDGHAKYSHIALDRYRTKLEQLKVEGVAENKIKLVERNLARLVKETEEHAYLYFIANFDVFNTGKDMEVVLRMLEEPYGKKRKQYILENGAYSGHINDLGVTAFIYKGLTYGSWSDERGSEVYRLYRGKDWDSRNVPLVGKELNCILEEVISDN